MINLRPYLLQHLFSLYHEGVCGLLWHFKWKIKLSLVDGKNGNISFSKVDDEQKELSCIWFLVEGLKKQSEFSGSILNSFKYISVLSVAIGLVNILTILRDLMNKEFKVHLDLLCIHLWYHDALERYTLHACALSK